MGGGHGGAPQPAPADGIGEESGVIRRVQPVVCDVPDDGGRLLPADEPGGLEEEILRIQAEHGKCLRGYALENGCRSGTGQAGFLHQPAHQIIPYTARRRGTGGLHTAFPAAEGPALKQLFPGLQLRRLLAIHRPDRDGGHL